MEEAYDANEDESIVESEGSREEEAGVEAGGDCDYVEG